MKSEEVGFKVGSPNEFRARPHLEQNHEVRISTTYDVIYCKDCDEWIEPVCCGGDCKDFPKRPERPSDG